MKEKMDQGLGPSDPLARVGKPGAFLERWIDPASVATLYLFAALIHSRILGAPQYGDEPLHLFAASHWLAMPRTLTDVFGFQYFHPRWVFFQRPAFYLLYNPAATISLGAFRVFNIVVTSTIPPLGYLLLRQANVTRTISLGAGLALCVATKIVVFGTFGFMDGPATALLLLGWWCLERERTLSGVMLLVASVWAKEIALVPALAILAWKILPEVRNGAIGVYPLRLTRASTLYVAFLALAPLPLMVGLWLGLETPGVPDRVPTAPIFEDLNWSPLLLLIPVLGVFLRKNRGVSIVSVTTSGFLLGLHLVGRAVGVWYYVLPTSLGILATGATLDALSSFPQRRAVARAGKAAAILVAFLLGLAAAGPSASARAWIVHPVTHRPEPTLLETIDFENHFRDRDWRDALGWLDERRPTVVLTVDEPYPQPLEVANRGSWSVLVWWNQLAEAVGVRGALLAQHVEANGTLTLVAIDPGSWNQLLRETYSDCIVEANARYALIQGEHCVGNIERFDSESARLPLKNPAAGT